jgi:hypothetical protein
MQAAPRARTGASWRSGRFLLGCLAHSLTNGIPYLGLALLLHTLLERVHDVDDRSPRLSIGFDHHFRRAVFEFGLYEFADTREYSSGIFSGSKRPLLRLINSLAKVTDSVVGFAVSLSK